MKIIYIDKPNNLVIHKDDNMYELRKLDSNILIHSDKNISVIRKWFNLAVNERALIK